MVNIGKQQTAISRERRVFVRAPHMAIPSLKSKCARHRKLGMNILLTGGAGYVGSHTAFVLKNAGFTPVVLDSLVTGHEWAVKYGPFVKADVSDTEAVRTLCAGYKPAAAIHFAAFIEVAESVADPAKYMKNNFHKASHLFEILRENGVNKVVFSSTAAVYGTPRDGKPITEDHPLRPINPYGESKLAAENYLRSLEARGMRSFALRYFNAAGAAPEEEGIGEAHDPETHLIPNIVNAGLHGKPALRVFGTDYSTPDGTAIRDYIHVLDLAEAHIAALHFLLEGGDSGVCNLGTGRGTSVREAITAVENVLGKKVPVIREGRREGDPPVLVADSSKAGRILQWKPRRTLEDIIISAVRWHESTGYRLHSAGRK